MNDLTLVANILLDCEEKLKDGQVPLLDYVRERCDFYKLQGYENDILRIISRIVPVYNIGSVNYDFTEGQMI